jgi:hypothetical protein
LFLLELPFGWKEIIEKNGNVFYVEYVFIFKLKIINFGYLVNKINVVQLKILVMYFQKIHQQMIRVIVMDINQMHYKFFMEKI